MEHIQKRVEWIKIWLAVGLCIFGCLMVLAGFIVNPLGVIHNSVLIVTGEIFSFAGCILGINMAYQSKLKSLENKLEISKHQANQNS